MLTRLLISFLCIFLILQGCVTKTTQSCLMYFDFIQKNDISQISDTILFLKKLNTIIEKDTNCIDALLTKADLLYKIGETSASMQDYKSVVKKDSNNIYAYYQLGVIYNLQDHYDSSLYYLNNAWMFKSKGNSIYDYRNDNSLFSKKARYDIASEEIAFFRGINYYYSQNLNYAKNNFLYCLNNDFNMDKVYLYLGAISIELDKDIKTACDYFSKANLLGNPEAANYLSKYCK